MANTEEELTFERVTRWANANARAVPTLEYLHDLTRRAVEAETEVDHLKSELTEARADYAHDSKTWRTDYKKVVAEVETAELALSEERIARAEAEQRLALAQEAGRKKSNQWEDTANAERATRLEAERLVEVWKEKFQELCKVVDLNGAQLLTAVLAQQRMRKVLERWLPVLGEISIGKLRVLGLDAMPSDFRAELTVEPSERAQQATEVFASAVKEAVEEHIRAGRIGYRDGKLVILTPETQKEEKEKK